MTSQCEHEQNGHCHAHGVEIERRKNMAKELNEVKAEFHKDMKALQAIITKLIDESIPEIRGRQRWMSGLLYLLLLIFGASFLYAYQQDQHLVARAITKHDAMEETDARLERSNSRVERDLRNLTSIVQELANHQAKVEGKTEAEIRTLVRSLEDNNQQIKELIKLNFPNGAIK